MAVSAFALSVPDDCRVCVPVKGGVVFDQNSPYAEYSWKYPVSWELPFVIVMKGEREGVLYYSPDRLRYASLTLVHSPGRFDLDLGYCPFTEKPFTGAWQDGAALYADIYRRSLPAAIPAHPYWTNKIKMAVFDFGAPMTAYEALAKDVKPETVLIYYPDWRTYPYDVNYPDYTMSERAKERISRLKAMGFRIMLHTNIFGVGYGNPLYKRFSKYQLKNRVTGAPDAWTLCEDPIGYMNAAEKEWQDFFVGTLKDIYAKYKPDAVYLDQAYYIDPDNDPGDCVLTKGTEALLQKIRRELPGLALGGEGANGVVAPYLKFCALIPLGINHASHYGDMRLISSAAPVTALGLGKTDRYMWHNSIPWLTEQYGSFMAFYDTQPAYPAISMEPGVDMESAPARYSVKLAVAENTGIETHDGVKIRTINGRPASLWSHIKDPVYEGKRLQKDVYYYIDGTLWPEGAFSRPLYLSEQPKRLGIRTSDGVLKLKACEGYNGGEGFGNSAVIPDGCSFLAQLPYDPSDNGPKGEIVMEFRAVMPRGARMFSAVFDFGAPGLAEKSDGFEVRVSAARSGVALEKSAYCRGRTPFAMDLARFVGRDVTLTITISPGKTTDYDFIRIDTPVIGGCAGG
ncbi:MAG: hypothetical protein ILO36_00750 [Abditibacteriota bacterium]|nr:hypothetical protein [Abditibacteriota bacterium]